MRGRYPTVAAWGLYIGDFTENIQAAVKQAEEDNAPPEALYKREDGTWATMADIRFTEIRKRLERSVAFQKGEKLVVSTDRVCYVCKQTYPKEHYIRRRDAQKLPPLHYKSCRACRKAKEGLKAIRQGVQKFEY